MYEEVDLLGNVTVKEVKRGDVDKRRKGARKGEQAFAEQRRDVIPLADLEDWLDYAEALLGTHDVAAESLVASFDSLDALERYEDELPDWMGMDRYQWMVGRFPWAAVARGVAERQGFFHWELEYAQVFGGQGGFDLQVGNPPWVRPRWREALVLAELEPWFSLSEKPGVNDWRLRKQGILATRGADYLLQELADYVGTLSSLGSASTFPHLVNTQPDLYRAFMARAWANAFDSGIVGLVHPDSHFGGVNEGPLRAITYQHLRFHAHFINRTQLFSEIDGNAQFGIHIYGAPDAAFSFWNMSWVMEPSVVIDSLTHDGYGELPGIRHGGGWDIRPHKARVIRIQEGVLREWAKLSGENTSSVAETPLLYPVTNQEGAAISALANAWPHVADIGPLHSRGFDESRAKASGLIRWESRTTEDLAQVILQGPHFGIATPFNKQPNIPCRNKNDWTFWDWRNLPEAASPATNYVSGDNRSDDSLESWNDAKPTDFFGLPGGE